LYHVLIPIGVVVGDFAVLWAILRRSFRNVYDAPLAAEAVDKPSRWRPSTSDDLIDTVETDGW
jgi:hypothetical protein